MVLSLLLGVVTGVASHVVLRNSGCYFQVHAAGSHQGNLGQISSGQVRFGDIAPATFRIENDKVWDSEGRGCWWTPPTNVLQCDTNQAAMPGVGIGCDGQMSFLGQTTFYQCATDQKDQWNLYLKPDAGNHCGEVSLISSGCHAECPQPAPAPQPEPQPEPKQCPANLQGAYEFPHLIIPVDKYNPDKAMGTSFFGEVTPSISSLFNFDIPGSDHGKTCTLVFLFPEQSQLETSSYSLSGEGKIDFSILDSPVSTSTTWNNKPGKKSVYGTQAVTPGHSYTVATFPCPAGQAISVELDNSGSTNLRYFQDYNPSPIGLYITKC
ncbi:hypothetical protein E4U43_004675 [Claviceps pusilla]|uniref:Ubiquitin 3 binding protein But2 C-terminal domain-containing protein n=1 Tax=Claviceps pusilla TaxID=123648 RepID=A0A9P7SVZ3_9HYPO|nr:hypothetical protein E4U43_004675 [Claviceps pusilla]